MENYRRPDLWTIKDACVRLSTSRSRLYDMWRDGHVDFVKIGRRTFVPDVEVQRIAQGRPRWSPPPPGSEEIDGSGFGWIRLTLRALVELGRAGNAAPDRDCLRMLRVDLWKMDLSRPRLRGDN